MAEEKNQLLLMQIALKCADIGHPLKPQPIHLQWSQRCFSEFYNQVCCAWVYQPVIDEVCMLTAVLVQGDEERSKGMTISPFCDRYDKKESNSQKGFLDFLVRPLITAFSDFVDNKVRKSLRSFRSPHCIQLTSVCIC